MTEMTEPTWKPAAFMIATSEGVKSVKGKILGNLAYDLREPGTDSRDDPPVWGLSHLGTGHMICFIEGEEIEAAAIASEFVQAGNWNFDKPDGWSEVDADLQVKVKALLTKHQDKVWRPGQTGPMATTKH